MLSPWPGPLAIMFACSSLAPLALSVALGTAGLSDLYVDASATNCASADGSAALPFCTIAEAVDAAVPQDRILIAPGTYFENLDLQKNLRLVGIAGAGATVLDGGGLDVVVGIGGSNIVTLEGLTIQNGFGAQAGGIYCDGGVRLERCVVRENRSTGVAVFQGGAGLFLDFGFPSLIRNTTFSGNVSSGDFYTGSALNCYYTDLTIDQSLFTGNDHVGLRGSVVYVSDADVVLRNSTISDNSTTGLYFFQYGGGGTNAIMDVHNSSIVNNDSPDRAGGMRGYNGRFRVKNTVVAGNTQSGATQDIEPPQFQTIYTTEGHNLIGNGTGVGEFVDGVMGDQVGSAQSPLDPVLGPLAHNGGPTQTRLPLPTSPLLDRGSPTPFEPFDQRGIPRPVGYADVGAVEAGIGLTDPACVPEPNSTGRPGLLVASASPLALDNEFFLTLLDLPAEVFGYFLTSPQQGNVPQPPGSVGILCLGGPIGRFVGPGQILVSDAAGAFSLSLDLTQHPTPSGMVNVQAGETWNFQGWHRDTVGGQSTSNFSSALSFQFR